MHPYVRVYVGTVMINELYRTPSPHQPIEKTKTVRESTGRRELNCRISCTQYRLREILNRLYRILYENI